jgi:glycosyltransferase involved in cell wall biosynthesis
MRVTIGICTWNRKDILAVTLSRLRDVRVPAGIDREVVVVDNNSSDGTPAVVRDASASLPLRYVFEPEAGLSHARNRLLAEARGDLVAFVDDDVLVHEGWLESLLAGAARAPSAGAFGGPVEPWFPVEPDPVLRAAFPALDKGFCGLDHGLPEGPLPPSRMIIGANMAFRKSAVAGLQFDPRLGSRGASVLGGEETRFLEKVRAHGHPVVWCPDMRVRHYVAPYRMTLEYLCGYYEGLGRQWIRETGMPAGACLFGVPRWIHRMRLETLAKYLLFRAMFLKGRALVALREHHRARGMLRECRTLRDAGPEGRSSPAPAEDSGHVSKVPVVHLADRRAKM